MLEICCSNSFDEGFEDYTICFLGVTYDFANKKSVWLYRITVVDRASATPDISHWTMRICNQLTQEDINVEVKRTPDGSFEDISYNVQDGDPSIGLTGWVLKINEPQPKGTTYEYRITIEDDDLFNLKAETGTIAIKAGSEQSGGGALFYDGTTCETPLPTPSINCNKENPPVTCRGIRLI